MALPDTPYAITDRLGYVQLVESNQLQHLYEILVAK